MHTFIYAVIITSKKLLGFSLPSAVVQRQIDKDSFWALDTDLKLFRNNLIRSFLSSRRNFSNYLKLYNQSKNKFKKTAQKINSSNLRLLSDKKIAQLYKNFEQSNREFMIVGQFAGYELSSIVVDYLKDKLITAKIKPDEIERILSLACTPFEKRLITRMEEEMLRLANKIKTEKLNHPKVKKTMAGLVKKYGWLPSMTINAPLWHEKFFATRIKKIVGDSQLQKKLSALSQTKCDNNKKKHQYKKLFVAYPKFQEYLEITNRLCVLKDERDEARRYCYYLSRPLYNELAKRMRLDINRLILISPEEIIGFLEKKMRLPSNKELLGRQRNYIIRNIAGKLVSSSDGKALAFSKTHLKEHEEVTNNKTITGIIASKGIVKGHVRLIHDKSDLLKINRGDVMVAITTHPDYLSAMKRAVAVVTDEGGLTCHAAIVSRELKIPCIVGTKIATKVLKDGGLVEVDANKAVIKILKRS